MPGKAETGFNLSLLPTIRWGFFLHNISGTPFILRHLLSEIAPHRTQTQLTGGWLQEASICGEDFTATDQPDSGAGACVDLVYNV